MSIIIDNKIEKKERSSYKAKILCIFFFLATSSVYFFPDIITNLFKPVLIIFLFFSILFSNERLRINSITLVTTFALLYFSIIFLVNGVSFRSFSGYVWLALYLAIILILSTLKFTRKDFEVIIQSIYIGGFLFALCILISNPDITGMSVMNRMDVKYLNTTINANGISYIIIPGILIGLHKIILSNNINKFKHIILVCIMLYPIFYSMSRGGFLALFIGTLFVILHYIKYYSIKINVVKIMSIILTIIILTITTYSFIPQNIQNRLFSFTSYELNNRDALWEQAFTLAKNNLVFGSGYSFYWENTGYSYGSHNLFIDLLVSTGLIGAILMVLVLFLVIIKSKKNLILYSFLTTSIVNSMVESGNSYSFWIPIIITTIFTRFSSNINKDFQEIFK